MHVLSDWAQCNQSKEQGELKIWEYLPIYVKMWEFTHSFWTQISYPQLHFMLLNLCIGTESFSLTETWYILQIKFLILEFLYAAELSISFIYRSPTGSSKTACNNYTAASVMQYLTIIALQGRQNANRELKKKWNHHPSSVIKWHFLVLCFSSCITS